MSKKKEPETVEIDVEPSELDKLRALRKELEERKITRIGDIDGQIDRLL